VESTHCRTGTLGRTRSTSWAAGALPRRAPQEGRKPRKIYQGLEELQADLDTWLPEYNEVRPHQGRWCYGKTPLQTFLDSVPLAKEKLLAVA
jgi:hypothetical protein